MTKQGLYHRLHSNNHEWKFMKKAIENDETVTHAVLQTISEIERRPIENLPRIYNAVDCDLLNKIFENRDSVYISFTYSECEVQVDGEYVNVELIK